MSDVKLGLHWQIPHTIFVQLGVFVKSWLKLVYSSPAYDSTPCQHEDSARGGSRAAEKQVALRKASSNDGSLSCDQHLSVRLLFQVIAEKPPRVCETRSHLHIINHLRLIKDWSPWNMWWPGDFWGGELCRYFAPALPRRWKQSLQDWPVSILGSSAQALTIN